MQALPQATDCGEGLLAGGLAAEHNLPNETTSVKMPVRQWTDDKSPVETWHG